MICVTVDFQFFQHQFILPTAICLLPTFFYSILQAVPSTNFFLTIVNNYYEEGIFYFHTLSKHQKAEY